MPTIISRDISLIKYRKLPLLEYDTFNEEDIYFYPENFGLYWMKIEETETSEEIYDSNLILEIASLLKKLDIHKLIFMSKCNKPWISKFTNSRKDYKPLTDAITYFRNINIHKIFNGAVEVEIIDLEKFLKYFYIVTKTDGGFHDFNFVDEDQNYIFYLHYSGDFRVMSLNELANQKLLKTLKETNFIDVMMTDSNRF